MWTRGHIDILNDALKLLGDVTYYDELVHGLKYPDFPCGKYKIKNGKLVMSKTLCSIGKFLEDVVFVPNIMSISYASHSGYFSIWHAMTHDVGEKLENVRQSIVEHILAMCKLGLWDTTLDVCGPNAFWIGFALHTLMDAYSPSHVLREGMDGELETKSPRVEEKAHTNLVKRLKESKVNLARVFSFFDTEMAEIAKIKKILGTTMRHRGKYDPMKDAKVVIGDVKRIVRFYYYPRQSAWFHGTRDFIWYARKYDVYEPCVRDCYVLLRLYQEALELLEHEGVARAEVTHSFLRKVYKYLMHVTFVTIK